MTVHNTSVTVAASPGPNPAVPVATAVWDPPGAKLEITTTGAVASVNVTVLSVDVDAELRLPATSCAALAARSAITVPVRVIPETAAEYVVPLPVTTTEVALAVPESVPGVGTSHAAVSEKTIE